MSDARPTTARAFGHRWLPLAAAAVGLAGTLATTILLKAIASAALGRVLAARLDAAGESACLLGGTALPSEDTLATLTRLNDLDAAYVLDADMIVRADARGEVGRRIDLIRVDLQRFDDALRGHPSVGPAYSVGDVDVLAGYFPIRGKLGAESGGRTGGEGGDVLAGGTGGAGARSSTTAAVLTLEAGEAFARARTNLQLAAAAGFGLSLMTALALGLIAARWTRAEARAHARDALAARAETMAQMAAMAAHEIRNPLGVIRGTVELMKERSGAVLKDRDREALGDILDEVERLRHLTEDFLDLATDRPMTVARRDLGPVLERVARATEAAFPGATVRLELSPPLVAEGDERRLEQVFSNLLTNAAQARPGGEVVVEARPDADELVIVVRDHGPGVSPALRAHLFDPFVTGRVGGTGLGLAITRRHVERHGGTIRLRPDDGPGAAFEVRLRKAAGA